MRTAFVLVLLVGCGKRNFNDIEGVDAPIVTCPSSYVPVVGAGNLKYSARSPITTSWVAAQMACLSQGAVLAIPTSDYAALALADVATTTALWIGASTIDNAGAWTNVYGDAVTYLPWNTGGGEPNG